MGQSEPAWFDEFVASGEACAFLSLCGNTAMQIGDDTTGCKVSYMPRGLVNGKLSALLEAPFEYEVLRVANGGDGASTPTGVSSRSRAIVLRPMHDDEAMYIAFRGARPDAILSGHSPWPGFEADRDCILESCHADMRYQGSNGHAHGGIAEYERVLCHAHAEDGQVASRGLLAWLRQHIEMRNIQRKPPSKVVLVGLSLGGSLAQAVALRLVDQLPWLRRRVQVVAFAPLAWASNSLAAHFETLFEDQAVTVFNCERRSGAPPPLSTWATHFPFVAPTEPLLETEFSTPKRRAVQLLRRISGSLMGSSLPDLTALSGEEHLVIDPAMSFFAHESTRHVLRQPRVAVCLYEKVGATAARLDSFPSALLDADFTDSLSAAADEGRTDAVNGSRVSHRVRPLSLDPKLLTALLHKTLREGHPLEADYSQLHMGRAYRETLVALFLQRRPPGWQAPQVASAEPSPLPPRAACRRRSAGTALGGLPKKQRSVERALCDLEATGELTSRGGGAAFDSLGMAADTPGISLPEPSVGDASGHTDQEEEEPCAACEKPCDKPVPPEESRWPSLTEAIGQTPSHLFIDMI